jgi:hypothetical protein
MMFGEPEPRDHHVRERLQDNGHLVPFDGEGDGCGLVGHVGSVPPGDGCAFVR